MTTLLLAAGMLFAAKESDDPAKAARQLGRIAELGLAMAGSLMISYTRAKAETLGLTCSVGLMQRAERVVLLGLGSIVFGLSADGLVISVIITIFAVLTNVTAIRRILWVYNEAAGVPLDG